MRRSIVVNAVGLIGVGLTVCLVAAQANATQPPRMGGPQARALLPESTVSRLEDILHYNTNRGLTGMVTRARGNRAAAQELSRSLGPALGPAITLPTAVQGARAIPVLTLKFANTGGNPFAIVELQKELFDGPWPTGTMTDFYKEMSHGKFTVTGAVFDWVTLGKNDSFYAGPPGCNGICREQSAILADMIKETLKAHDGTVKFEQFDNDGPDGNPNSGDDDGFVDFVAIVQPQIGGECGGDSIWSHRFSLSDLVSGQDFETDDTGASGLKIRVDDYTIMPSLACDGTTMIQMGVFAHEFGHAFGLPDLYDTEGSSAGIGAWGLMGSGSWGGDGTSFPDKPTHMEAWSKEYLGWLKSIEATTDTPSFKLPSAASQAAAVKVDIDDDRAFLIEYRNKEGFDGSLLASGLIVWRVKNSVINAGLATNRVNAQAANPGLAVVQADGRSDLSDGANRADDGDIFPGATSKTAFDKTSSPASTGTIALCNIRKEGDQMVFDILTSTDQCPHP